MTIIENIEFKSLPDDIQEYLLNGRVIEKKMKIVKSEEIDKGDYIECNVIFSEEFIKLFKTTIKIRKDDL